LDIFFRVVLDTGFSAPRKVSFASGVRSVAILMCRAMVPGWEPVTLAVCVFSVDYLLRLATADYKFSKKGILPFIRYPFSFMAVVDLLSILPSVTVLNSGWKMLRVLRMIRALRVFRVFKAFRYSKSVQIVVSVFVKLRPRVLPASKCRQPRVYSLLKLCNGKFLVFHSLNSSFPSVRGRLCQPPRRIIPVCLIRASVAIFGGAPRAILLLESPIPRGFYYGQFPKEGRQRLRAFRDPFILCHGLNLPSQPWPPSGPAA
jgi:hypothetical protein